MGEVIYQKIHHKLVTPAVAMRDQRNTYREQITSEQCFPFFFFLFFFGFRHHHLHPDRLYQSQSLG